MAKDSWTKRRAALLKFATGVRTRPTGRFRNASPDLSGTRSEAIVVPTGFRNARPTNDTATEAIVVPPGFRNATPVRHDSPSAARVVEDYRSIGAEPGGGGDWDGARPMTDIPGISGRTSLPTGGDEQPGFDLVGAQLAALGGGPNLGDYVSPFDAAAGRARSAYDAALPQIALAYDDLRGRLQAGQKGFSQEQARMAAEQLATQDKLKAQMVSEMTPVSADLAAQAGGAENVVPSLAAGLEAQRGQAQANMTDAAARQRAFLDNLARTQEGSAAARLSDSQLAQQAATANAGTNLNDVLGKLDVQRAAASRQYAGDVQDHSRQQANIRISAMKEQADLARQAAKQREEDYKALLKEEEGRRKEVVGSNASVYDFTARDPRSRSMPKTFRAFTDVMSGVKESGDIGRAKAHGVLESQIDVLQKPDADGNLAYGAKLSPEYLHKLIDEYYDQEEDIIRRFARGRR